MFTSDVVSFEQPDPDVFSICTKKHNFCDLFTSLDDESITNIDLVFEERIVPRSKMSFL